jgi:hypothetical protein
MARTKQTARKAPETNDTYLATYLHVGQNNPQTDHSSYNDTHFTQTEEEESNPYESKRAKLTATRHTEITPQSHNGLFIQNKVSHQGHIVPKSNDEYPIDHMFPSDAKPRLFHVISYLVQSHNDKLHYVKILFQHSQGPKPATWLAVRCLLQINIAPDIPNSKRIRVLAIMKVKGNSHSWHNCIKQGDYTEHVMEEAPNEDLGYSFCMTTSGHIILHTKRINNIEYGSEKKADSFVYTKNEHVVDYSSDEKEDT